MEELNLVIIENIKLDEDEEQKGKEKEAVTHGEFQNILQNKTYNGDNSYRMQDRKYLNEKILL